MEFPEPTFHVIKPRVPQSLSHRLIILKYDHFVQFPVVNTPAFIVHCQNVSANVQLCFRAIYIKEHYKELKLAD